VTGYIPGHCISTSLRPHDSYLVLADVWENVYRARRTIEADWDKVFEIAQMCGLQKLYPFGRCNTE